MEKIWRRGLRWFWQGWGGSILVAVVITTTFRSAIADWYDIPTGSMEPTILVGDRIFVNKLAYDLKVPFTAWELARWDDPKRGDIVVFASPADGKRLVKRIAGIPGDVVQMRNNRLFVNGKEVAYEPLEQDASVQISGDTHTYHLFFNENMDGRKHPVMITPSLPSIHSFDPIRVPERQYFMLGDNRDNSGDSRFWGFVARHRIEGEATVVALSLDRTDSYRPRWRRFLHRLP